MPPNASRTGPLPELAIDKSKLLASTAGRAMLCEMPLCKLYVTGVPDGVKDADADNYVFFLATHKIDITESNRLRDRLPHQLGEAPNQRVNPVRRRPRLGWIPPAHLIF